MGDGDSWGQPTWRDHVENRLGGLKHRLDAHDTWREEVREEVHQIREALKQTVNTQLGAIRADLLAEVRRMEPPAPKQAIDWKIVFLAGVFFAGALFGAGFFVAKFTSAREFVGAVRSGLGP
jgi:hypothetical protein